MKKIPILLSCLFILHPWTAHASLSADQIQSEVELLQGNSDDSGLDWAMIVQDAETGEVLYSKDPQLLLNPASNTKILTTLAALSYLGPDFHFKNQLIGEGGGSGGHWTSLTLKGFGDPTFTTERLEDMVRGLKAKGVRQIDELRIDTSYFDSEDFPGRFEGRQREALFNTGVGALVLDHNLMEVVVTPGEKLGERAMVSLNPPIEDFSCEGEVTTGGRRSSVSLHKGGDPQVGLGIKVNGSIPLKAAPQIYKLSCDEPGQLAGMRLVDLLKKNGIQAPADYKLAAAPKKGKLLVEDQSPPLSEVLPMINKKSDNFMAEQLAKVLGAQYGGAPGTTKKGTQAVLRELNATGIDTKGVVMQNGSGLSRETRVKVKTLADVLQKAYLNGRLRKDFISSLSVLGVDGTLRKRFRNSNLAGRFVGKTGTLTGVTALSGYAFPDSAEGEHALIFSYIINGSGKGFWQKKQLMTDLLQFLIEH